VTFLCSVCGAEGNKYELPITKDWVIHLCQGLEVTLFALQIAVTLLGLPIPGLSSVRSGLEGIIPDTLSRAVQHATEAAEDVKKKLDPVHNVITSCER
jgi:hypothetical protein